MVPVYPQRILITGAGIVSPLGLDWQENEASFRANRTAFRPVTMFDVSQRIARTAAHVDLPEERLFLKTPGRRQHLIDRGTKMLLLALRETLAMARLPGLQGIDAIIIGTSAGAMGIGQEYFRHATSSPSKIPGQISRLEFYQPHRQLNAIAMEYDWHGPMILVSNACASGANAIGDAMAMIQTGKAKRVLAGGYDALAELVYAGFDTLRALAPSGIPRPFDAARDGLALGEGAALVLLESEDAAAERGADAIAVAAGYATATDLHHLTQPDPAGKAAIRTMTGACAMAGIAPHEVTYINSHGTGTPYNDVAEASAVKAWAGDAAAKISLSSTKSAMGHLLGGAGAVEAVICLMAMRGQWMPGSLNIRETDPAVSFDLVHTFRQAPVNVTLTNSFGFGGTNATLVFTECGRPRPQTLESPASISLERGRPRPQTSFPPLRISGAGAVSSAGWGTAALAQAILNNTSLPTTDSLRTVGTRDWECPIRTAPPAPADTLPKFPRLRRASPITKFTMAAALEALTQAGFPQGKGAGRLGIVQLMFNGCVQFSGKFYHEVLDTPALASPLIFPETVYNAPASHVAAYLGVDGPATTLIGESSAIIEAVDIAHTWLLQDLVDHVLVIGAEECDWLGAEAVHYYHPEMKATEGAGALLLSLTGPGLKLTHTPALPFHNEAEKAAQLQTLAANPTFNRPHHITGLSGIPLLDHSESQKSTVGTPARDCRDALDCDDAPKSPASTPLSPDCGDAPKSTVGTLARDGAASTDSCPQITHHPRQILGEAMGAAGALQLVLATTLAQQTGQPISITLPGTLCASYGAVVEA
ncbi:3-oxoacyl-(acyl-carrier-protein) synthase [Prosthecobacter fusiformis]|uniref:3-oxoacyl-(Acyl-carrier-protein) synthase n=1 Tax=Prosthecobacter fusiformis TaxID=48464 RepID=A0A4R7S1J5_9BACT|nr:3-oxoacyl-(acyl-carrier-protein) synthase [Prosthecobacter fusiformis]